MVNFFFPSFQVQNYAVNILFCLENQLSVHVIFNFPTLRMFKNKMGTFVEILDSSYQE